MSNTLDEILETLLYGHGAVETHEPTYFKAKQQLLAEVLDMIGEDAVSIPSNGDDGLENQCQTCEYLLEWDGYDIDCRCKDQNKLRDELRKAAKERFK